MSGAYTKSRHEISTAPEHATMILSQTASELVREFGLQATLTGLMGAIGTIAATAEVQPKNLRLNLTRLAKTYAANKRLRDKVAAANRREEAAQ